METLHFYFKIYVPANNLSTGSFQWNDVNFKILVSFVFHDNLDFKPHMYALQSYFSYRCIHLPLTKKYYLTFASFNKIVRFKKIKFTWGNYQPL